MVTPEQWRQVRAVFDEAVALPAADRKAFLDRACAGEPARRREVESLLEHHDHDPAFLETGAGGIAAELIAQPDSTGLPAGHVLGPYRIVRPIGRGGMGEVYLASDTRLGRDVALKLLPGAVSRDPLRRERLRREARAAAAVSHAGVAHVYAFEEAADGTCYIVSEYVAGHPLRDEIASGPLSPDTVVATALQIARAVAAAHARGIVHRDLKPENVIRSADGTIKVLDFGLAHQRSPDGGLMGQRLTETGTTLGTPGYMSPEQLRGQETGPASDIFSLGLMIQEMATGAHAFAGPGTSSPVARLLEEEPISLPDDVRDALPGLAVIVDRCLRKEPARRYPSMQELAGDLEVLIAGRPPAAQTASRGRKGATWWWQFHQVVICGLYLLAVLAAWAAGGRQPVEPWHRLLFVALVAAVTASITARLNLLFTFRVRPAHLPAARHRARWWIRAADGLIAGLVLGAAGLALATGQFWLAAGLAALSAGGIAALLLIEPVASLAAFGAE